MKVIEFDTSNENSNADQITSFLVENSGHVLQSFEWGELREKEGHQVKRVGLLDKDKLIAYCQITIHRLPKYYPLRAQYVGDAWRGPVLSSEVRPEHLVFFFDELKKLAERWNCVLIKFEPGMQKADCCSSVFDSHLVRGEETMVPATAVIDLTADLESINQRIDRYTRKNIRKAEKKGVVVHIIEDRQLKQEAIHRLFSLLSETSSRANFRIRSEKYYTNLLAIEDEQVRVFLFEAEVGKKTAASYVVLGFNGTLFTPYSGSSREFSEFKANEAINWKIIEFGKERGYTRYDQWGVLPEGASDDHPMMGVSRFKIAFGGKREEYIGAYDLVVDSFGYRVFGMAWKLRAVLKKLGRG